MLAAVNPSTGCVESGVDIRTGQANGMRQALNTRYDMYENPLFGGNKAKNKSEYRPARNVIKGYMPQGGNACDVLPDPAVAMGWPRDACLDTASCPTPLPDRQGDGNWPRSAYWTFNHPGVAEPFNITVDGNAIPFATASRYQMYEYEIEQSMIPNNSATGGEDGRTVNRARPTSRTCLPR